MKLNDQKKAPARKGKMPTAPIQAPKGNIKGIGPLGYYTGGLDPLVVKPVDSISQRWMAPTIMRGYNGSPAGGQQ